MVKADLISALSLAVEDGRVKIALTLPEAGQVIQEFQRYERKTPLGTMNQLALSRDRPEDDIILSLGMSAWSVQNSYTVVTQKAVWPSPDDTDWRAGSGEASAEFSLAGAVRENAIRMLPAQS